MKDYERQSSCCSGLQLVNFDELPEQTPFTLQANISEDKYKKYAEKIEEFRQRHALKRANSDRHDMPRTFSCHNGFELFKGVDKRFFCDEARAVNPSSDTENIPLDKGSFRRYKNESTSDKYLSKLALQPTRSKIASSKYDKERPIKRQNAFIVSSESELEGMFVKNTRSRLSERKSPIAFAPSKKVSRISRIFPVVERAKIHDLYLNKIKECEKSEDDSNNPAIDEQFPDDVIDYEINDCSDSFTGEDENLLNLPACDKNSIVPEIDNSTTSTEESNWETHSKYTPDLTTRRIGTTLQLNGNRRIVGDSNSSQILQDNKHAPKTDRSVTFNDTVEEHSIPPRGNGRPIKRRRRNSTFSTISDDK